MGNEKCKLFATFFLQTFYKVGFFNSPTTKFASQVKSAQTVDRAAWNVRDFVQETHKQ